MSHFFPPPHIRSVCPYCLKFEEKVRNETREVSQAHPGQAVTLPIRPTLRRQEAFIQNPQGVVYTKAGYDKEEDPEYHVDEEEGRDGGAKPEAKRRTGASVLGGGGVWFDSRRSKESERDSLVPNGKAEGWPWGGQRGSAKR